MSELLGERANTRGPSPAELDFMAEEELVTVIPRVALPLIALVSGDFGPFEPDEPCTVPLWLALSLKRAGYCSVVTPSWLRPDALLAYREEEEQNAGIVTKLPFHYHQIASMLLSFAADDIGQADRVQELLEDLVTVRQGKLRALLHELVAEYEANNPMRLGYMGSMELFRLRPALIHILTTQRSLQLAHAEADSSVMEKYASSGQ
jgi:GINS complex subunit 2